MTIRRLAFSAIAVLVCLIASTLFLWMNREVKAVSVQINVKDLPEYGLKLIPPTDPSFQEKLSSTLEAKKGYSLEESLKHYSVLFENKGTKTVVGYRLTWEMTKADGTVSLRQGGGVNPGALMGKRQQLQNHELDGRFAVKPNSMAFVSLVGAMSLDGGTGLGVFAGGLTDQAAIDEFLRTKDTRLLVNAAIADLRNFTTITVSIDGVFFEDGTFVGPDATGLFANVEAELNAKRDLMEEIAFALQKKQSVAELFAYIEEVGGGPPPNRKLDREGLYNLYKKMEAETLLRMASKMERQRVLDISQQEYRQASWPKLKKL